MNLSPHYWLHRLRQVTDTFQQLFPCVGSEWESNASNTNLYHHRLRLRHCTLRDFVWDERGVTARLQF